MLFLILQQDGHHNNFGLCCNFFSVQGIWCLRSKALFTRAIFVWQFLCDKFYLLVYMRTFAQILCDKYICRKTSLPVFMWQTKIVNYKYLFVYMTRHIFVACIYLHVCLALCDYNIVLKTNFLRTVKTYLLYHLHEQSYLSWKIVKQKLLV